MTPVQDQTTDLALTVVSKIPLSADVVRITLTGNGSEPLPRIGKRRTHRRPMR